MKVKLKPSGYKHEEIMKTKESFITSRMKRDEIILNKMIRKDFEKITTKSVSNGEHLIDMIEDAWDLETPFNYLEDSLNDDFLETKLNLEMNYISRL